MPVIDRNPSGIANPVVPNPDPSVITSQAIDRRVESTERAVNARMDGMQKAVDVFQNDLTRVPTQLDRAINGLRDLMEARLGSYAHDISGVKEFAGNRDRDNMEIVSTRLNAMDKAMELLHDQQESRQTVIDTTVSQLRSLHDEKFQSIGANLDERDKRLEQRFISIDTQFAERDKRTEQLSLADKTAIAAALQAQKEAAGATNESNGAALAKMENNFTKQIEAGQINLTLMSRNLEDKMNDLKSRMDRGEGKSNVMDPAVTAQLNMLTQAVADLSRSRDVHAGGEKTSSDGTARMLGMGAIAVAFAVGVGEIIVRLAH
jgi:hypothetical protein